LVFKGGAAFVGCSKICSGLATLSIPDDKKLRGEHCAPHSIKWPDGKRIFEILEMNFFGVQRGEIV
jgi:hypothetical protein